MIEISRSDLDQTEMVGNELLQTSGDEFFVVALPTDLCFRFIRSSDEMKRLKKRSLIAYELEDYLPYDGDQLAIDILDGRESTMIVATSADQISKRVKALESSGYFVTAIVPRILLALGFMLRTKRLSQLDALVLVDGEYVDVIKLSHGKPCDWIWVKRQTDEIVKTLDSLVPDEEVIHVLSSRELAPALNSIEKIEIEFAEESLDQMASRESELICQGRSLPLVDLRDGPLASKSPWRPIRTASIVALLGLFILQLAGLAALVVRDHRQRTSVQSYIAEQESTFTSVFPDESIPVGILSRLESEHRRLAGTRGLSQTAIPKLGSIAPIAHRFLSALPERDIARFKFDRIEFAPETLTFASGTAKSYSDQEMIEKRLRSAGLDLPPMSAETTSRGVTIRLENVGLIKPKGNTP